MDPPVYTRDNRSIRTMETHQFPPPESKVICISWQGYGISPLGFQGDDNDWLSSKGPDYNQRATMLTNYSNCKKNTRKRLGIVMFLHTIAPAHTSAIALAKIVELDLNCCFMPLIQWIWFHQTSCSKSRKSSLLEGHFWWIKRSLQQKRVFFAEFKEMVYSL